MTDSQPGKETPKAGQETAKGTAVQRTFVHPPDAPAFHAEFVQITGTETEVILQFYANVPGVPGAPQVVTTLQATVAMHPKLARRIMEIIKAAQGESAS